jgi:S-(hydroxymethyl)glutathione dehydrogenase/alcohol dehydrogenase
MLRVALAFVDGKRLEIVEVDLDCPKRDEILVEIRATDICQMDEFTISGAYLESLFPARGLVHEMARLKSA